MIVTIPQGVYTMKGKMSIIKENARRYRKALKKEKSKILDELTAILHLHKKYIAHLLRNSGKVIFIGNRIKMIGDPQTTFISRRGRKKIYTNEIIPYLKKFWVLSGYRSSIHLVVFMRINREMLFNHPELSDIEEDMKNKLLSISSATVDRLLKPTKEKAKLKHKYRTNPYASHIKKNIPVESYFDKPKDVFGYVEIDLVHHCGETARGEFAYTLTVTEITTGWTELRSIKNKAQVWTHQALEDIYNSVPFKIIHLHCDNGSEFINAHIVRFVEEKGIEFTRSREYHKNDAPYVESKNWTMVRSYTGYRRYDTDKELSILQKMMRLISVKHNYFIPMMKMVYKKREGRKVYKRYNVDTPLNRLLHSGKIDDKVEKELIKFRVGIDYIELVKKIERLQDKLDKAYRSKYDTK